MAWKKSSPEEVRRFDERVAVPGPERGVMFGCPVYALNGERYAVLHEGRIALRLSEEDGAELIKKGGWPWEPMKGLGLAAVLAFSCGTVRKRRQPDIEERVFLPRAPQSCGLSRGRGIGSAESESARLTSRAF